MIKFCGIIVVSVNIHLPQKRDSPPPKKNDKNNISIGLAEKVVILPFSPLAFVKSSELIRLLSVECSEFYAVLAPMATHVKQ